MTRVFGHYVVREMAVLLLVEAGLSFGAFYLLLLLRIFPHEHGIPIRLDSMAAELAAALSLLTCVASTAVGLYRPESALPMRRLIINTAVGGLLVFIPTAIIGELCIHFGSLPQPGPMWLAKILIVWVTCIILTRVAFAVTARWGWLSRKVLVIGDDGGQTRQALSAQYGSFMTAYNTAAINENELPSPETLAEQGIWGIVVGRGTTITPDSLVRYRSEHLHVFDHIDFIERHQRRVDLEHLSPNWLYQCPAFPGYKLSAVIRRLADIVTSLAFLLTTLPVSLLAMLAVKIDGGPIFYSQERVGLNGKTFFIRKFRSMRVDAEKNGAVWASKTDNRVTPVGKFLRRARIDEIPQVFNILKGEMSFIGPRPERPQFVATLNDAIPNYSDRAWVKPGLTGWAQVNYPYGASIEDARMKLSYDLYYIRYRSLFLDVLILISTVRVVLFQEGAR